MSPSYRMGKMGGRGRAGGCGIRSTFRYGARREHGSYKEASKRREARIEDGKHSRLAKLVLHSMDLAIEERIKHGIARAGAKIVPREI